LGRIVPSGPRAPAGRAGGPTWPVGRTCLSDARMRPDDLGIALAIVLDGLDQPLCARLCHVALQYTEPVRWVKLARELGDGGAAGAHSARRGAERNPLLVNPPLRPSLVANGFVERMNGTLLDECSASRAAQVVHVARRNSARPRHLHGLLQLPAHPSRATGVAARTLARRSTISSPSSGCCRPCQTRPRRCRWPADRPSPPRTGCREVLGLYRRVSHPLDDKLNCMSSPHHPVPSDQPFLVAPFLVALFSLHSRSPGPWAILPDLGPGT
jgi:hypothetical protein